MADKQDKQQESSRRGPQNSLFKSVKQAFAPLNSLLSNPILLDTLRTYPLFGNVAIALLLGGIAASGYFLFDKEDQINPANLCQKMSRSEEVIAQLKDADSSRIISATPTRSKSDNALFACEFSSIAKTEDAENSEPNREKFNVVYQLVNNELIRSVEDEKIEQSVLKNICKDKDYYTQELARQGYDPTLHNIEEEGLVLEDESNNVVYPVFRWKCKYKRALKATPKRDRPTTQPPSYLVGLDLDAYCEDNFEDKNLIKARYRHYHDPTSLYCVNPNF